VQARTELDADKAVAHGEHRDIRGDPVAGTVQLCRLRRLGGGRVIYLTVAAGSAVPVIVTAPLRTCRVVSSALFTANDAFGAASAFV